MIETTLIEFLELVTLSNVYAEEAGEGCYVMAINCKNVARLVLDVAAEAEGLDDARKRLLLDLLGKMQIDREDGGFMCWWPCSHETWISLPMKEA